MVNFHCRILHDAPILALAKACIRSGPLQRAAQGISFSFVKRCFIALLALVVGLHAGVGCGVAQAVAAAIETPCCGGNCPFPSTTGDAVCCHAQNSGGAAQAVSAKASLPSLQAVTGSIRPRTVMPALTGVERTSLFQNSPPGAVKLALLCSRQI